MSVSGKCLFITGSSGALGSQVLRALTADDGTQQIIVGSRSVTTAGSLPPGGTHWPLDLNQELTLPDGVQTILHIAGEKRDVGRMWSVNHVGTRRLIEAAAKVGATRFIYISSVGVYGASKHAGRVDALHRRTPGNTYEASKNAGETVVRELCSRSGMEFVVVQPTNVLVHAPGHSYPLLGLMSSIKSGRFTYFGSGEPWLNYVHVEDAAAAIAVATVSGRDGATYIVNTPASLPDLVQWIAEGLGTSAPSRHVPALLGAMIGIAGSALQSLMGRGMPFSAERYRELTNTTRYDGEVLNRDLGFSYPVGIETAVRRLVAAYRLEARL